MTKAIFRRTTSWPSTRFYIPIEYYRNTCIAVFIRGHRCITLKIDLVSSEISDERKPTVFSVWNLSLLGMYNAYPLFWGYSFRITQQTFPQPFLGPSRDHQNIRSWGLCRLRYIAHHYSALPIWFGGLSAPRSTFEPLEVTRGRVHAARPKEFRREYRQSIPYMGHEYSFCDRFEFFEAKVRF